MVWDLIRHAELNQSRNHLAIDVSMVRFGSRRKVSGKSLIVQKWIPLLEGRI
jgi:hypothetical protein